MAADPSLRNTYQIEDDLDELRALRMTAATVIAEHVWLLENTNADRKFLVFGNDRRVPEQWLERYGPLVRSVEFYFLDDRANGLSRLAAAGVSRQSR